MLSADRVRRLTALLLIPLLTGAPQTPAPRYTAEMLECAVFREDVRSDIRSESGTVLRQETAGRTGLLFVRAIRSDSGIALTAWYDSLGVWRSGPEGRNTPDTDGLLGGQWQGTLSAEGRYAGAQVPFIPDAVAEIADLRGVLGDFFPPLARGVLTVASARDARYAWSIKARMDTVSAVNDTLDLPMRRASVEEGTLSWNARLGPARWERTITVTGDIDAKGPIRRGIRSVVTQRIQVTRLPERRCD